ncbi:hypothetical protein SAMN05428962_5231 [Paenibacillus sp. BC26]|nr:hypothetical protein SAMN05428962_5231 [Paenibacillus sp. BC26]
MKKLIALSNKKRIDYHWAIGYRQQTSHRG